MKYKLKSKGLPRREVNKICINCGKRELTTVAVYPGGITPNTTQKIYKGGFGPMPGTWLSCKLGNHNFYYDYEVETVEG